jgi:hypothetical protein
VEPYTIIIRQGSPRDIPEEIANPGDMHRICWFGWPEHGAEIIEAIFDDSASRDIGESVRVAQKMVFERITSPIRIEKASVLFSERRKFNGARRFFQSGRNC